MNILVLATLTQATGNAVTARRVAEHLATKHKVTLVDTVELSGRSLRATVEAQGCELAVGVHALLAGTFLRTLALPYTLIFGGTDLYEPVHELQQTQMAKAVANAAQLVAFSAENIARAEWMWPACAGRVRLLPQAVALPEIAEHFSLRAQLGLGARDLLVVLPTGIRRVKDPLHVVDALSIWHVVNPRIHLAVVGAVLEPDYAEDALRILAERPGVHFVEALPRAQMLAAMREADMVINTSLSEGMCGAVLEAMALGTPVLARRNAGNESLITHGHSGLLYDAPGELVHWLSALGYSAELRERIRNAALAKIQQDHTLERERDAYLQLVDSTLQHHSPALERSAHTVDELENVLPAAERVGLNPAFQEALGALVKRIYAEAPLARTKRELAGWLGTAPPAVAIAELRRVGLELGLGKETARCFYLLLALLQVPACEARHRARGIAPELTTATLHDLALWAQQHWNATGFVGITLETLAWAQRYLRGELLQLGPLQFDLRPFEGKLRVFRHRTTRQLLALSLDGRRMDLGLGAVTDELLPEPAPSEWRLVLQPGSPILEMWIPLNTLVTLQDIGRSMREAYRLFDRLCPQTVPVAIGNESWRMDLQAPKFLPAELGFQDLQRACFFYPSSLPEAKTVRRLFGPEATREKVLAMDRSTMEPVQRAVATFLSDPNHKLQARCGFALREDAEAQPEWNK